MAEAVVDSTVTQDISSGGFSFVSSTEWKVGAEFECNLDVPLRTFGSKAVRIRCRGKIARIVDLGEGRVGVGATIDHYDFFAS